MNKEEEIDAVTGIRKIEFWGSECGRGLRVGDNQYQQSTRKQAKSPVAGRAKDLIEDRQMDFEMER